MKASKPTRRTCPNGHQYFKSSDCPVCPVCENKRTPAADFMEGLSAPARRALENAGIKSLKKLSSFTKQEVLKLHGIGPAAIPFLTKALADKGLSFEKS